ncbi:hypothetical protein D3C77_543100 [compost metagenome]
MPNRIFFHFIKIVLCLVTFTDDDKDRIGVKIRQYLLGDNLIRLRGGNLLYPIGHIQLKIFKHDRAERPPCSHNSELLRRHPYSHHFGICTQFFSNEPTHSLRLHIIRMDKALRFFLTPYMRCNYFQVILPCSAVHINHNRRSNLLELGKLLSRIYFINVDIVRF